jgi:hypothetical protein
MNTKVFAHSYKSQTDTRNLPTTPRGRALYTIDWFLNGKPVLRNHDNPQLSITKGCHC